MSRRKANPQRLAKNQHVVPAASIKRFVDGKSGCVTVWRESGCFIAKPDNSVFTAKHAWGHGIETGLMKRAEDRFQRVVGRRLSCLHYGQFDPIENRIITRFHALCCLRSRIANDPPADARLSGIGSEALSQSEQDILEKKGYLFAVGDVMPSRHLATLYAQLGIDRLFDLDTRWSLVFSHDVEFVVSERFGELNFLPITPHCCLAANQPSGEISRSNALQMNATAFSLPARFWFARSFSNALL